ncbi:MAG: hypothetical protein NTV01_05690, partial [Bacteroidia bacterium]|nr:hypothetical protein [Bacteroidia bacterium]
YGQSRIVEMQNNEDVIACKSRLNSGHDERDICDFYAEADLYGMGPGVFPKNHMPPYPYHPFCKCVLADVYIGEVQPATAEDFNAERGRKYLGSISASDRKDLLGVGGSQRFKENPKKWEKYLKNYERPIEQKAQIPLSVLYGEE